MLKKSARLAAGIDHAFGVKDEAALALVRRFDLHWIGRHWDAGTRQAVTGAVAFSGGTKVLPGNVGLPPYHFRCRTITVAYLGVDPEVVEQDADEIERWQMAARQREVLPKRDLLRLIERARMARWDNLRYAMSHVDKHRDELAAQLGIPPQTMTLDRYNALMDDLIRRGDREIALSLRRGRLYAEFSRQTNDGQRLTAVVNVSDGKRATLHVKRDAEGGSLRNEIFTPQGGKGVQKWLGVF